MGLVLGFRKSHLGTSEDGRLDFARDRRYPDSSEAVC